MFQQSASSFEELDIESPRLVPFITYPSFDEGAYSERIAEMKSLGVTSLSLGGRTKINGIGVAGKGWVGLVLRAKMGSKVRALKIRRVDADRKSMDEEARLHGMANASGVGPRLEGHSKNLLAMEFIDGMSIIDWVSSATAEKVRETAGSVLEQCYSLDRAGLDHGELSRLDRHVMVSSDAAYIIDFESASTTRKMCNVTAATQSVFLYGAVAGHVSRALGASDRERVIGALKAYKRDQTRERFETVLAALPI